MPFEVILNKTAYKTYSTMSGKLKRGIDRCLSYLEVNPTFGPNIVKLKGVASCYRYQVGGWRILYEVDEPSQEVRVYSVRTRGDVYKH